MRINHFEDTRALSEGELNEALVAGDARTRVFAIWALAMRASGAVPGVVKLEAEPDPGVRRAIAVVLAGHGELDLLVALSRHDPNAHVRASAARLLVSFARAGQVSWEIVEDRLADAPVVQASVLTQVAPTDPGELHRHVLACVHHDDAELRREAFEAAMRLCAAGALEPDELRGILDRASAPELDEAISLWFALATPSSIARALEGAPQHVRERALQQRPDLALSELGPLIFDDADLFQRKQRDWALQVADAPTSLVLRLVIAEPCCVDYVREALARLAASDWLAVGEYALVRDIQARCAEAISWIDGTLAAPGELEEYLDEMGQSIDDLISERTELEQLRAYAERLAGM